MLLLPLCLILKSCSALLFIYKQTLQKSLITHQCILQMVCRLMNEHTQCCQFTESFYMCIYLYAASPLQSFIMSEMSLICGTQDITTVSIQKSGHLSKKPVLCVFTHVGGRLLLRNKDKSLQTEHLYCSL